ncbi:MAG: potassium channel family protein, partial [Endomicrobiales bacterium]
MSNKQYAVIGLGTFGFNVAKELSKRGIQVLAVDIREDLVNEISPFVSHAVVADATEEKVLRDIGLGDCDVAIIAIGESMETSILITLLAKELGVKNVIVKSVSPTHSRIAAKIGANRVVYPEYEMAKKLAESVASPNILEEIELSPEYNIVEMVAPDRFWGKTISGSGIRPNFRVSIIAIKRLTPVITEDGETDTREEINIA